MTTRDMTLSPNTPLSAENVGLLKAGVSVLRTKSGHLVTPVEDQGMSGWIAYRHIDNDHRAATMAALLTYIGPDLGDGWIGWGGGPNPVPGMRVRIRTSDGWESVTEDTAWDWTDDITAFRPALSPPAEGVSDPVYADGGVSMPDDLCIFTATPAPAPVDWERVGPKLVEALERIAADGEPYRNGYCQTDIAVDPALTAQEAQDVARAALSAAQQVSE